MLKDDIGFTASSTSKLMRGQVNVVLKPYGITAEQWTVLKHLSFEKHLNQKDLSQRTDKDQATLTKILDLLEHRGLAARIVNPDDRRSFLVEITTQGKELVQTVLPLIETIYEDILHGLSSAQLDEFMKIMKQIQQNIKHIREEKSRK
ncbi:MarR family winged helix-turn-helix transcriptional regulator [Peribacillus kribbensis]|uniref:MarR family winged helix-turn-helix transcriptional regulator n=1 Tax=Peribacillus kribbensis TaxID=356658 RepID=UPI000424064D|nr:MarR family transcriptional regulator [Peribacillus kribbensis]